MPTPSTISNPASSTSRVAPALNIDPPQQRLAVDAFLWGAGIECSFLPHLNVDQFDWTQHNRFWKQDLQRARNELGITNLRYSLPWHLLEPARGRFDWTLADERIQECQRLGIDLLMDVMHFGTPLWLKQAVGDPEFPEALERFTEAFVTRYADAIRIWCPFNEPLVSALFSGDYGFWPPHQRKWRGYMPVLSRIVQAVNRGIRTIRRVKPDAVVLLCDATEHYKSRNGELSVEVARRNLRRFVVLDLLLGRVDHHHALYDWLTSFGMSEIDLDWFRLNPQTPDVIGLDYYPHSDWNIEKTADGCIRQRRADNPIGIYGLANQYWKRYGIPMMLTETSIEGKPINREIWLESNVEQIRRLREEGVPMLGLFWWPMLDQIDWDGAMTHRIGKIHEVGMFSLKRQQDGTLARSSTPLVKHFQRLSEARDEAVGELAEINYVGREAEDEQLPPVGEWLEPIAARAPTNGNGNGNGNSNGHTIARAAPVTQPESQSANRKSQVPDTGRYGIVVFSHLRWGFVWQRPQQFLSRFARKHDILFIEEPFFDLKEGVEPRVDYHRVMPNVTVVTPHCPASWNRDPSLPHKLVEWTRQAINHQNEDGAFDKPLLWYYSPMDSAWSLGHFENRGVVYDCMDELSQFTGAPKQLVQNEARLIEHADIVFTGGYELGEKKRQQHDNVHTFGCGVEFDHFNKADDPTTVIPPDIDFMPRPILGWFGVVDERVDYALVGEVARLRPDWSFAMLGPVVKVDPNLLPHSPNLFWMGGRDYQILPNYCRAFDICIMPFAMNASTQYINPTKGLEYMATGRPVISTPVRDVVRQWSDIVEIVRTADEFTAAAERLLDDQAHRRERIERGLARARQSSWEQTVENMQSLIRDAIGKSDRRSKRQIAPLDAAELEYQYRHTPGS